MLKDPKKSCNASLEKLLHSPRTLERPGAAEARAIQRQFEWKAKMRTLGNQLTFIENDLKSRSYQGVAPRNMNMFDADDAVKSLENEGVKRFSEKLYQIPADKYKNLKLALESLSNAENDTRKSDITTSLDANEWSAYAKAEEERRAFVQAAYRRFRIGPVQEVVKPNSDKFEYEHVDFTLPSGEIIKQPVAHMRDPPAPVPQDHIFRDYTARPERETVGVNTTDQDSPVFGDEPLEDERRAFIARLVHKARSTPTIREGQKVNVSAYGLMFPGTVVRRNIGEGTFTIRFEDNTVSDFSIHSIVL